MGTDYEVLARRYDEDRARWSFPPDDVVEELVSSRTVVRVLDLGCGTGRWLAAQRDRFHDSRVQLLGADPSVAMLAEAGAKSIDNLIRARAEELPLKDAAVEYVVSSYAFHHFVDKDGALDEVSRVLTSDGVLRINNIEPTAAAGWWVYEFFPEAIPIDAARFWPPARIARELELRHFDVDIKLEAGTSEIPASEALDDAERRVISQLALLNDNAYARGLDLLRHIAARSEATVTTIRSRLSLTARRR